MQRAMELAAGTRPHPNPRVGALVLDASGAIVAAAAHQGPGRAHAEAAALVEAAERARGGTVVVTLEPCCVQGMTPPCTDAIVAAGVARVVYGAPDPDERVSGRGAAALRDAGIEVVEGVPGVDAEALDPAYFHHRRTGSPLLTLKAAVTLDGQAAAADGTSQWITSPEARADAHGLRAVADAVLVGAGTVLSDDPRLTVRLPGYEGPQPQPIVVAGTRPLRTDAAVLAGKALVYSPVPVDLPAEVVVLPAPGSRERVDLAAMAADLAGRGHLDVLVEGGPTLASALLTAGLVERGVWYVAGMLGGGVGRPALTGEWATLGDGVPVRIRRAVPLGPDVRIDFEKAG